MKKIYFLFSICFIFSSFQALSTENSTITFSSNDGIKISADTYLIDKNKNNPIIVLFHQAGWSRGEYLEIAPKLNQLGFNCIAVDLRSGGTINGITNETAIKAKKANKPTRYLDALPDILSALRYAKTQFPERKVIAWGSSYSAALVLHIGGEHPDLVDGILSFAPGEYFSTQGKSKTWIKESASKINVPVFITSAREEKKNWYAIYEAISSDKKAAFLPETKGNHGSRALWGQFEDSSQYWDAVKEFLTNNFL